MRYLKLSIKYTIRGFLFLLSFIFLYLILAWILPKIKLNSSYKSNETGIPIFVSSNGIHTDFILPAKHPLKNWRNHFIPSTFEKVDSTFEYVSLGWGDKGFYLETPTWDDLKFSTAFKAAFFMSSTAMHVTYKKQKPVECATCKKLILTEEQYKKLIIYIYSSFQKKNESLILINHIGYNEQDNFYEANGTYSLFKTCNVWTGNGLQAIGVKIGCWTPFQGAIIDELK